MVSASRCLMRLIWWMVMFCMMGSALFTRAPTAMLASLELPTHIASGGEANLDPNECIVPKAWQVVRMFCDMHAEFQFNGFTGMKLSCFFARSPLQGHWQYTVYIEAGQKGITSLVQTVHAAYLEKQAKVSNNEVAPPIQTDCSRRPRRQPRLF